MNLRLTKNGTYAIWFSRQEMPPSGRLISLKRFAKRSIRDEDEAKEIFQIIKRKWHQGRLIELDHGKRISLDKYREEYIGHRKDKSPDTLRADKLALKSLGDVLGPTVALKAITSRAISKFKKASLARGLSPVSLNTYLRHIRTALRQAFEWDFIDKVPLVKYVKVPKHQPRILTKKEINKILQYAKKNDHGMWRIIGFALWTGARRQGCHNARWQNIIGNTIRIKEKGDRERTIPLRPGVKKYLCKKKDIGPIFDQCHVDNYSKRFKKIARQCKINDVKFHNLRHSAASYMIKSGMHPNAVQEIMGHVDFRTTKIYIKLHPEFLEQEMEKFKI